MPGDRPDLHSVFALEKMLGALKAATSGRLGLKTLSSAGCATPRRLNLFRSLAKDNGLDPETFINSLGGQPSFSDCAIRQRIQLIAI
jgi:hypothetical protein